MPLNISSVPPFNASTLTAPAQNAFAITPSNTVNFDSWARAIYVGGAGDVAVVLPGGTAVTFAGAVAGTIIPVVCGRINVTNTTATNLVGLV